MPSPDDDLWQADLLPFGSARYYAVLQHADSDRARLKSILQLQQIWSLAGFSHQPGEAVWLKLDWWRNELEDNHQRHPLSRALASSQHANPALTTQLLHMLQGYRDLARNGSPGSDDENKRFHFLTGGCACLALANCTDGDPLQPVVSKLGIALSHWRCLRYLRRHVSHGLLCLPQSTMSAAGIEPSDLKPGASTQALQTLFKQELARVRADLAEANSQLLEHSTESAKALYVYTELQCRLAATLEKSGARLLESEVRLTPLKNHWLAGSAARRFTRHMRRG